MGSFLFASGLHSDIPTPVVRAVVITDISQYAVRVLVSDVAVRSHKVGDNRIRPARRTLLDVELILQIPDYRISETRRLL